MSSSSSDNAIYPDKLEMPKEPKPSTSENFKPATKAEMAGHEQDTNPTKKGTGMSSAGTAGKGSEQSMGDKVKEKLGM